MLMQRFDMCGPDRPITCYLSVFFTESVPYWLKIVRKVVAAASQKIPELETLKDLGRAEDSEAPQPQLCRIC